MFTGAVKHVAPKVAPICFLLFCQVRSLISGIFWTLHREDLGDESPIFRPPEGGDRLRNKNCICDVKMHINVNFCLKIYQNT